MRYFLRLLSIAFAIIIWPVTAIANAFAYQPSAHQVLGLRRLTHLVEVLPIMRSRFRAFIDRAMTHANFTAGHFDPGRMPA